MLAIFKTKLRPRFIEPFTVVATNGLVYTLNLLRKLHKQPEFYVGLLKTYWDPSHVNLKPLAPRELVFPLATEFESGGQAEPLARSRSFPAPEHGPASRQAHSGLTQWLTETTQLEKHLLILLPRTPTTTDVAQGARELPVRCGETKKTTSLLWPISVSGEVARVLGVGELEGV